MNQPNSNVNLIALNFEKQKQFVLKGLFFLSMTMLLVSCGQSQTQPTVVTVVITSEPEPEVVEATPEVLEVVEIVEEPTAEVSADAEPATEPEPDPTAVPEPTAVPAPADEAVFEPALNFTSVADGFQFRNYSSNFPEGDLTFVEAQEMFGDVVCTRFDGDTCIPHPKVSGWLDNMNETMHEVGHCTGFTVVSNQLHSDVRPIAELGADQTFDVSRGVSVMQDIAQGYASFYASNVWRQEVREAPTELLKVLNTIDEPVDIGMYYPEYGLNGHSVLGHNVIDQGDGVFHIEVYDSNRPGEDNIIVINTNDDSWFYADAAVNPDVASSDYRGDGTTKSLTFIPISAYNEPLSCPADFAELCAPESDGLFSVVTLVGKGEALANAAAGQIGRIGDALVNTIANSRFLGVRGEYRSRQHPIMLIPEQEVLDIAFQATQADEILDLSVSNPNFSVSIKGVLGQPGQIEQLTVDPVTQQTTFVSGGNQRPIIELMFNQGEALYVTQISNLVFEANQQVNVSIDPETGDLEMSSPGLFTDRAAVLVTRITSAGEELLIAPVIITPGSTQALDIDGWDGGETVTKSADEDGDGEFELVEEVPNLPIANVMGAFGNPDAAIDMLQIFAPYLDEAQAQQLIERLPTVGYLGPQLGRVYLALPSLEPNDLVGVVSQLNLTPEQVGEFIFERRMDDGAKQVLLDGLALPEEDNATADIAVANQQKVNAALDEWSYQNELVGDDLAPFIAEQGLDEAQQVEFINEVDLPAADTRPIRRTYVSDAGSGACSEDFDTEVSITFVNRTNEPVEVIWVNYDCGEEPYRVLYPGQSYSQETFVTHPWRVRTLFGELLPLGSGSSMSSTHVAGGGTVEVLP